MNGNPHRCEFCKRDGTALVAVQAGKRKAERAYIYVCPDHRDRVLATSDIAPVVIAEQPGLFEL